MKCKACDDIAYENPELLKQVGKYLKSGGSSCLKLQ